MPEPGPISLSDQQLDAVFRAAEPLQPYERCAFLAALARLHSGRSEIGDGEFFRSIRDLQREHFKPPVIEHPPQRLLRKTRCAVVG
jgi:hypothetical protein